MPIVVAGNVFVDIKGFPDDVYIPAGRNAGQVVTVHGGVGRNVAEDIANLELRPRFVSMVDDTAEGEAVRRKLEAHKTDTKYLVTAHDGMGIWLAVFDHTGDVAASISKRPDMSALLRLVEEKGDEIFSDADSIVHEIDMDKDIIKAVLKSAKKYGKKVIAVVANMSIASQRRDLLTQVDTLICNSQEAGILFLEDYAGKAPEELRDIIAERILSAGFRSLVVTMGGEGCVYASADGEKGICPANKVNVKDTTGAGDAFCAGVAVGLTYGKGLAEAVKIGTRLAASVIVTSDSVCPRFRPAEFGLEVPGLTDI